MNKVINSLIDHSPNWAFHGQWNQNDETNHANEHKKVKNPSWSEEGQLTIYKCDQEVEPGSTEKQLQLSGHSWTWTHDNLISRSMP